MQVNRLASCNVVVFFAFSIAISFPTPSLGHGRVMEPVHRGARWRFNNSAPPNYNDNELFCGGFSVQWQSNAGQCGLCGDNYNLRQPRPHELGGKYGEGVIVRSYTRGDAIKVVVFISANHMGYFYFDLCNLDVSKEEETCFKKNLLLTTDGAEHWKLPAGSGVDFTVMLRLPNDVRCQHCVLRWTYATGEYLFMRFLLLFFFLILIFTNFREQLGLLSQWRWRSRLWSAGNISDVF